MKAELLKPTTDAELERYHNREEVLVARGIEEERKKWIKEAIRAGILISKPEELAGIITTSLADICLKHRKAGLTEAVEWVEKHDESTCMDCLCAYDFRRDEWQAFKKKLNLEG